MATKGQNHAADRRRQRRTNKNRPGITKMRVCRFNYGTGLGRPNKGERDLLNDEMEG